MGAANPKGRTAIRRTKGKRVGAKARALIERKNGRPSSYDPTVSPEKAMKYAMLGLTDVEVAGALKIDETTFYRWCQRYPEFREALASGKVDADSEVAASMFNLATGKVRMPAVKVFYDKDKGEAIYAPYVEAVAPNVAAQKLWLTNRQPNKWRERKEIEVSGGIEHQITLMTPEQRMARLLELQAKAALVIEGEAVEVAMAEDQAPEE